jgi:hypothetical protein
MQELAMSETIDPQHRHPSCTRQEADCRVTRKHWIDTLIHWTPVYDGTGAMINTDPNRSINEMSCATCGRRWQVTTEHGVSRTTDTVA